MRKLICALCLFLCACDEKPVLQGQEFHIFQNGLEITLGFGVHDNRYYGKAVNSYYGIYQINKNKLHFFSPSSTMYMGDEEEMTVEENYLNQLEKVISYRLDEEKLILILSDQQQLEFQKK